jgi:hypothetical protein
MSAATAASPNIGQPPRYTSQSTRGMPAAATRILDQNALIGPRTAAA